MKRVFIFTLGLAIFFSCKRDDSSSGTLKTRKDTLTSGAWRITAITATGRMPFATKDTTLDIFGSFDSCARDDRYIFQADGKMINDQYTNKCYATEPQQMDGGTWSISAAGDTLEMKDGTLPGRFQIGSFSGTSMTLLKDTSYLIFSGRLSATLVHE